MSGGRSTLLELEVDTALPASALPNGPIPVEALVGDSAGEVEGRILIWVSDGYLAGLEFAWFTDVAPHGFPKSKQISLRPIEVD